MPDTGNDLARRRSGAEGEIQISFILCGFEEVQAKSLPNVSGVRASGLACVRLARYKKSTHAETRRCGGGNSYFFIWGDLYLRMDMSCVRLARYKKSTHAETRRSGGGNSLWICGKPGEVSPQSFRRTRRWPCLCETCQTRGMISRGGAEAQRGKFKYHLFFVDLWAPRRSLSPMFQASAPVALLV